jgi:hypothetical protein
MECRQPLEAGKEKETGALENLQQECSPADT